MKAIDLKNSILGLAISGKLTSQEPTDESVDTLIENIQKFKENLILNGRLKPNKKKILDTSVDESLEVPKSWRVVRLGDIADLYTGDSIPELIKSTRYAKVDDGYDYIGTKDVGFDNVINYSNGVKIPFDEKGFKQAHKNSILLCIEGGSAGRKIAKLDRTVCFGNKLCAIAPFGFDCEFLYYYMQSDYFRKIFNVQNSGIIGGVSIKKLFDLSVPLPPLDEQKRIVKKIKQVEPLVIRYGEVAEELAQIKSSFPESLRNSILQHAIEGKLVPQDPEDEPAEKILEEIKNEFLKLLKAGTVKSSKMPKLNEPLNPATQLFQIPDSWTWTTLSQIGLINPRNDINDDATLVSFIPMESITSEYKGVTITNVSRKWGDVKKGYTHLKTNDVIMAKITPCFENKKSAVLCNMMNGYGAGTTELHVFRGTRQINPNYVLIYLRSPFFSQYAMNHMTGTAGQQRVPTDVFKNYPFPLPPIKEQERIVKKTDELMELVKALEKFIQ